MSFSRENNNHFFKSKENHITLEIEKISFIKYMISTSILQDQFPHTPFEGELTPFAKQLAHLNIIFMCNNQNHQFEQYYTGLIQNVDKNVINQKYKLYETIYNHFMKGNIDAIYSKDIPLLLDDQLSLKFMEDIILPDVNALNLNHSSSSDLSPSHILTSFIDSNPFPSVQITLAKVFFMMDAKETMTYILKANPTLATSGAFFQTACLFPCPSVLQVFLGYQPNLNEKAWVHVSPVYFGYAQCNHRCHHLTPLASAIIGATSHLKLTSLFVTTTLPLLINHGASTNPKDMICYTKGFSRLPDGLYQKYETSMQTWVIDQYFNDTNSILNNADDIDFDYYRILATVIKTVYPHLYIDMTNKNDRYSAFPN